MRCILLTAFILVSISVLYGQDTEVLHFRTEVEIQNGVKQVEVSYLVQVNNDKGASFNPIRIHYDDNTPLSNIKIQLETADGRVIRSVKKKEMKDYAAVSGGSFYEDSRVRIIPVPYNVYPYRIRCSYRLNFKDFLTLVRWDPYLRNSLPFKSSTLSLIVPSGYELAIREQGITHSTKSLDYNRVRYTWESEAKEKIQEEAFGPTFSEIAPSVQVVPMEFQYGVKGQQGSWEEFGNWVYRLNKGRDILPTEEARKVDRLLEGVTNEQEKVRILYHHMQDFTRYINVSIDLGGLQAYPASYVCKNGFGDCKALSNYMKSLLSYAGIEAYYTLIWAGTHAPPFHADFPSNQFNHVMVCVPQETDTLWLECTNPHSPFGYISDFTQDRYALLIDEDHSMLVRTPALQPSMVGTTRTFDMEYSKFIDPEASMHSVLRGDDFEIVRGLNEELDSKDREESMQDYLNIPEAQLKSWSIEDTHRDSTSILLEARFDAKSFITRMGNAILVNPPAINIRALEEPEERQWPVHVVRPFQRTDSLKLRMSSSVLAVTLPSDTLICGSVGTYSRRVEYSEGSLLMVRNFQVPAQRLNLEFYPDFYTFIEQVKKLEKEKILFKEKPQP